MPDSSVGSLEGIIEGLKAKMRAPRTGGPTTAYVTLDDAVSAVRETHRLAVDQTLADFDGVRGRVVREARAATVQEIARALDELRDTGAPTIHRAAWLAGIDDAREVARCFASPTGTGDNDG